jgi:hypothetical protein
MISVVVTICHLITLEPGSVPVTACFERVAGKVEINLNACVFLQPGVANWKENSRYAGDDYFIGAIRCVEGDYRSEAEL